MAQFDIGSRSEKEEMIKLMNPASIKHEEWSNVRSRLNRHGELRWSATLSFLAGELSEPLARPDGWIFTRPGRLYCLHVEQCASSVCTCDMGRAA
ncbi:Uncharacterized protein BM_BM17978 [Brugia malayi]|uniref:Uncharacterized protein n=1 Tax=Brugia malayi TaxID=6279 RepID=A0A4E9EUQ3_BRUMA|nr:Uncharacterized protein BM_BM17978 [Brugia malayi]VIO87981.1 Uncharacterized protein BM_BM17978 [Brugia malayi]